MRIARRFLVLPLLLAATSLAAQQHGRAVVFQVFGGGTGHLRNLNSGPGIADFNPGYNLGGAIGVQANEYIGVHADLTYTRNMARGSSTFSGTNVDRFFYGAHVEISYPRESGVAPFAFAGGGAVTVTQAGVAGGLPNFTKPAAMFGAGLKYQFGKAPVELLVEGKSLVYKWDRWGFSKTQWDLSYSAGLSYRFGL